MQTYIDAKHVIRNLPDQVQKPAAPKSDIAFFLIAAFFILAPVWLYLLGDFTFPSFQ